MRLANDERIKVGRVVLFEENDAKRESTHDKLLMIITRNSSREEPRYILIL